MTEHIYFRADATEREILLRLVTPLQARLKTAKHGMDVEISEHKQRRTTEQNRFYWSTVGDIADVLNDAGATYGEWCLPYTAEILHEINKKIFGVASTAKLSKAEFCDFIDRLQAFWIERTNGCYLPKETAYSYLERTGLIEAA